MFVRLITARFRFTLLFCDLGCVVVGFQCVAVDCQRSFPLKPADAAPTALLASQVSSPSPDSDSRVISRLTVTMSAFPHLSQLTRDNVPLMSYDLIAVAAESEALFEAACKSGLVDIIHLDCGSKLPFLLRKSHVRVFLAARAVVVTAVASGVRSQVMLAQAHGVSFDLEYTQAVRGMVHNVLQACTRTVAPGCL